MPTKGGARQSSRPAAARAARAVDLWITGLEAEGRIEQTTISEYRRVLDNLVLPSVGGLKPREATTGRLDRLLLRLRDQSVNRQLKAKVVLGAMLDLAVRHDAIPTNPSRGTSRVHRAKQETKALRVEDLVEIRAALRWSDLDLDGEQPVLTVSGTIKTETGKGTYRKPTPKSDASRRTVVLPRFATDLLCLRREFATPNENDAVFATLTGTWHQVVNIERRWRQIRKGTGYEWVTPHTFRRTVATLISEATTSELASRQLGHSSSQVTRDHYMAKPPVSADLSELLERLAESDDAGSDS